MKNKLALNLIVVGAAAVSAQAGTPYYDVLMSVEAPSNVVTSLPDVTIQSFSGITAGNYPLFTSPAGLGTYTTLSVVNNDQYGGATGTGDYAVTSTGGVGAGVYPSTTLTFNSPVSYFGLWWSAGDAKNTLTFYNGANQVAQFTTADLIAQIPNYGITSGYYGNPTSAHHGANGSEPYAFINFYGVSDTTFTSVTLSEPSTSGFENDNNTIRVAQLGSDPKDPSNVPGYAVERIVNNNGALSVTNYTYGTVLSVSSTPEPSTNALLGMAGVAGVAWLNRRRASRA